MLKGTIWETHKFGGTSLADAECFHQATRALMQAISESTESTEFNDTRYALIVSALSGVTDALISALNLSRNDPDQALRDLKVLAERHQEVAAKHLSNDRLNTFHRAIESDCEEISHLFKGAKLGKKVTLGDLELVSGYGELWSAHLMSSWLEMSELGKVPWLDAREVLVLEDEGPVPFVDWPETRQRFGQWLTNQTSRLIIITGYIASTRAGVPTTLKRNGSDTSAAIFASLLSARRLTIWKDVDGFYSADPRRVPEAQILPEVSYQEAMELAYFGAKVIHPNALRPVIQASIPIVVRNTFKPKIPGTLIHAKASSTGRAVKGFSTISGIALVNLEGSGMVGVPGVAERVFGSLAEAHVSVVLISQASSEHSICFAISEAQAPLAKKTLEWELEREIAHGAIEPIGVTLKCGILAAVGDGMAHTPGVAARFFSSLARTGVNVRAIAQGSSERNISAVIDEESSTRALRAVHAGFTLSDQTLALGLIGPGSIGSTFLKQLAAQADTLRERFKIDVRLQAIANSKKMILDPIGIPFSDWKKAFEAHPSPVDLGNMASHLASGSIPHAVIVDCSASEAVAREYPSWLAKRIHVITPNKKANSLEQPFYDNLREISRSHGAQYYYEATVGAGLPVINTLRDLTQTGDQVLMIEGILSGTLSFIFNSLDTGRPFSSILKDAIAAGYTEPDPRDDLSGMDVARKAVILAREMGMKLDLKDIPVESLVPDELRCGKITAPELIKRLSSFDAEIEKRRLKASVKNEVLRYVAVIDPTQGSRVELKSYPKDHPFTRVRASDNIIAFTTTRYRSEPLIIQGPGAGPDVTAGGVFADLLRLAGNLGAVIL